MKKIEQIREAVIRHRGGLEGATDSQIMIIWNSLDKETQKMYQQADKPVNKERKGKDATGN